MSETSPTPMQFKVAPGARLSLALLMLINLVNYIDRYNLAAVESLIEKEPGFFAPDDGYVQAKMGSLAFAFMAAYMVFAPLFGWIGDRWSRWKLIAIGVALWSLATMACGWATGFVVLFLLRCTVGVGEAAYGPAAPSIIADLFPVARRGRVISWFYAAIPVGSALGYALGGVIAGWLGWRWVFYLMGPPGLVLALWCWFMRDPPRGQSDQAEAGLAAGLPTGPRLGMQREYRMILTTKSFLLCTLGMTAMAFSIGGVAFWMPRYIAEFRRAGDLATVNLYFGAITVVAGLSATLAGGWLGDLLRGKIKGSYFIVSGGGMVVGFALFIAVLIVPFPAAWILVFLAIFFLFFNTGPTNTILANVIHPTMRASAVALNIFIIHAFGDAISPFIIGLIADLNPEPVNHVIRAGGILGGAAGVDALEYLRVTTTGRGMLVGLNAAFLLVSGTILASGAFWLYGARFLDADTAKAPLRLAEASAAPSAQ